MRICVIDRNSWADNETGTLFLQQDRWDDFSFKTSFYVYYKGHEIGCLKIAYRGMQRGEATYDHIPKTFTQLPDGFFSLWQNEKSYSAIVELNAKYGCNLFAQLNDIAYDLGLFEKFRDEESTKASLFRSISEFQCREQFHRIAIGGTILTDYRFSINIQTDKEPVKLGFSVIPNTKPSTNIHMLIGRNGIGKTNIIKSVVRSISGGHSQQISLEYEADESTATFANVLCISFSPFDDYTSVIDLTRNPVSGYPVCSYIGLDRDNKDLLGTIEKQFLDALRGCLSSVAKIERWTKTIHILNSDPMFAEIDISGLVTNNNGIFGKKTLEIAKEVFGSLSSGHKCVLSLLTNCVNRLEERSIVLIDEPENHLHPPLLAALIQAMAYLLNDRNGVAIISTHSPVILQEIPRSCVWIINRIGNSWSAERPRFETFGADISSLNREVFGLEILHSGYHKMIKDVVDSSESLDDVLSAFDYNLGNEAMSLASIMWNQKIRGIGNV